MAGLIHAAEAFLSLLYPWHCAVCGIPTSDYLCAGCLRAARRIRPPFCQTCSQPFDGDIRYPFRCANCGDRHYQFDYAVTRYLSKGVVRELIHRFKYRGEFYLRHTLAGWLCEGLEDPRIREDPPDWIVPVPLYPAKRREREFNQAEALADLLGQRTGIPVVNALRRVRNTSTQTRLDRQERMENLRNAFDLRQNTGVRGLNLLLVDDVFTTGSTVNECARALRAGGAVSVRVMTVARG